MPPVSSFRFVASLFLAGLFGATGAHPSDSLDFLLAAPEAGSCTVFSGPLVTGANLGNLPDFAGSRDDCGRQHCFPPQISPIAEPADPGCDPWVSSCDFHVGAEIVVPENTYRVSTFSSQRTFWFAGSSPPNSCPPPPQCNPAVLCGEYQFGQPIDKDQFRTYLTVPFTCSNPAGTTATTRSILVSACYLQGCQRSATQVIHVDPTALFQGLCRPPRKDGCPEDQDCRSCTGPGGSVGPGGDGPGFGGPGTGPGARLRYVARGAGTPYTPGAEIWRSALGRNWSHDYAMRIFLDPAGASTDHVWLVTEAATFREFWNPGGDGIYASRSPASEYRQLELLGVGGWILHELDGREHEFDSQGRWTETRDRSTSGNAKFATYNLIGQLETVTMPDGRVEELAYHADGKLASITEVGVGGTETRQWQYSWSGHDLRLVRWPDGTFLRFEYGDSRHPGYLTRVVQVAIDLNPGDNTLPPERTLRAYAYDGLGNVVQAWTGAATFAGGSERYQLSYDDPVQPETTTVTVTIDTSPATTETLVYSLDRPAGETKVRVLHIDGTCSGCGDGANTQYLFEDPSHPFLPTRKVDGNGVETELEYEEHGQLARRIDAANNPDADPALPRETRWEYHPDFPSFVVAEIGPATLGLTPTRRTDLAYDAGTGDLLARSLSGIEATYDLDGSFTPLTTDYSDYNAAGRVGTIDPPGHGTSDQTTLTYDPARGDLLPLTRTEPLQGTTSWTYTPFNRVASITDASGVVTETFYDAMDRPTQIARRGPDDLTEIDDLVTVHTYNVFGDLYCVKLPEGNGIEHLYDGAGRLVQIVRGRAVAEPSPVSCLLTNQLRERSIWTLDNYGHRTNERLERTTTSTWPANPDAETEFVYSSRCQLSAVIQAPGVLDATTEYDYQDCAGNLTHVWDPKHPRASNPATTIYEYDALDRLTAVRQRWGGAGPASEAITTYGYDVQDHLVRVIDAEGNETDYVYSDRDLLTSQTSVAAGTTTYRYDEHGALVEQEDGRGIVTARAVDAADRVTLIDHPGSAQDVAFEYGDAPDPIDFTFGRLTEIVRDPAGAAPITTSYRYDRFGRMLQDGDLVVTFDKNGNPLTTTLPGSVVETLAYDAMDRPVSLAVDRGDGPVAIVSGVTYKPQGPLAGLTFGTSPARAETRGYDRRYAPQTITVAGSLLSWTYTTDPAGNVTAIQQTQPTSVARSFAYQDFQDFLTCAAGPWAPGSACDPPAGQPLAWSLDKIGNRLSEARDGATDTYSYLPNAASGNTPLLDEIALSTLGTRAYAFDAAGYLEEIAAGANVLDFGFDAEGRLAGVQRTAESFVDFRYDGRGFLAEVAATRPAFLGGSAPEAPTTAVFADDFETGDVCEWTLAAGWGGTTCPQPPVESTLEAVYDSSGRLRALFPDGDPSDGTYLFYLAGRPVAMLQSPFDPVWTFLTTDHLGTPILALDGTATPRWLGGFEPYGHDWQSGAASATANGIPLRLPGQWSAPIWEDAALGAELFYNLHRWYEPQTGRYDSADPLGLKTGINLFSYGAGNPVANSDPDGRFLLSPRWTGCPAAWFLIAKFAWQGQHGNRYTHCRASCEIARGCGPDVAVAAGFAKEALDVLVCQTLGTRANCDSAADPQDIKDDFKGIFCLEPCDKRCEPLKGAPDVAR